MPTKKPARMPAKVPMKGMGAAEHKKMAGGLSRPLPAKASDTARKMRGYGKGKR